MPSSSPTSVRSAASLRPTSLLLALLASVPLLWACPAAALDAEPWEAVLRVHARSGRMDYRGLRADAQARASLDSFLRAAEGMPEGEPLSSWLNVYNALVVRSALAAGAGDSLRSVQDVAGFFDRQRHRVAGRARTLNDIENGVIRRRFSDPRIHAALNCAARGCPPLHGRAFRERDLDTVLESLTRRMVRSEHHVSVRGGEVHVSAIFLWYRADFEGAAGSLVAYLRRFAEEGSPLRGISDGARIVERPYNWALNQL